MPDQDEERKPDAADNDGKEDEREPETGAGSDDADEDDGDKELPEAVKAILQKERKKARDATAAARAATRDADEAKAELEKRKRAEMSELERAQAEAETAKARADKAEADAKATALRYEVAIHAGKANFHDVEDAHRLIDHDAIEYGDDGQPTNVEALIKALAKAKPHLVKQGSTKDIERTPGEDKSKATREEIEKAGGSRIHRVKF